MSAAFITGPVVVTAATVSWTRRALVPIDRVIEDPPRRDYGEPVSPVFPPVYREGFGTDPLQEHGFRFFLSLSRTVGYREGLVLAAERGQGALQAGASSFAADRAYDARNCMRELFAEVEPLVGEGYELSEELLNARLRPMIATSVGQVEPPERLIDVFPPEVQAALFRSGITVDPFLEPYESRVAHEDPFGALAESLVDACQATRTFAEALIRQL